MKYEFLSKIKLRIFTKLSKTYTYYNFTKKIELHHKIPKRCNHIMQKTS